MLRKLMRRAVVVCGLCVFFAGCHGPDANVAAPSAVTVPPAPLMPSTPDATAALDEHSGARLGAVLVPTIVLVSPASTDKLVPRTFVVRIERTNIDLPLSLNIDKGADACDGNGASGYPVVMDQDEKTITLDTYNFPAGTWFGLCVYRPFTASSGDRRIRVQ